MMSSELCLYPLYHSSSLLISSVLCYPWSVVLVPCHHYRTIILEFMTFTTPSKSRCFGSRAKVVEYISRKSGTVSVSDE